MLATIMQQYDDDDHLFQTRMTLRHCHDVQQLSFYDQKTLLYCSKVE